MTVAENGDSFRCPGCGRETDNIFLYSVNNCRIFKCLECGLGRTVTDPFDARVFYSEDYFNGGRADGYADYAKSENVLRGEFKRLARFVRRLVPHGRLLELGCAYGFFLNEVRGEFEVTGIEVSPAAALAGRKAGLNVINAEIDESSFANLGLFDAIIMADVIEHLPDPEDCMRLCSRHLKPGGVCVITTGDFASPVARVAQSHWRLMTPPQHLWFFTVASMRHLAHANGLRVESIDHPWKFVPLSLVAYQLKRIMGFGWLPRLLPEIGVPVNLFDAMRVVLRKSET